jgi:hypothetical protein
MKIFPMRGMSHFYKLIVAAGILLVTDSCKKAENGFGLNNQVVIKPYSMFLVDTMGQMYSTNDGNTYKFIKNNGGNAGRAVTTSGNNVVWVMKQETALVSVGNENQFNPIKHFGPNPLSFNQSLILDVPEHKKVYMAGNDAFGVVYSDTNGKAGSWYKDMNADGTQGNMRATSLAKTNKGIVFAHDYVSNTLIKKADAVAAWTKVYATNMPTDGKFFLGSFNDKLILGDSTGKSGVWFSNDDGVTWEKYQGLPEGAIVTCLRSAFGQVLLVGTAQYGIFRVANGNTLTQVNNGLESNLIVRNITSKSDIYKDDKIAQYVYTATSKGIFRSVDLGANWIQVKTGNYVLIY